MKEIVNELEAVVKQGYDFSNVFSDWLTLMVSAFCRDEETYMQTVNRYRKDGEMGTRPADHFAKALGALMTSNRKKSHDYLGDIFTEHVTRGANSQYFTPDAICKLMVQLTMPELKDDARVLDPSCGSGRILLHAAKKNRLATFYGVDIDQRCTQMTALNLLFRNVNGYVVWGNTLTLECWGCYGLHRSPLGGEMFKVPVEDAKVILESVEDAQPEGKITQMGLFDQSVGTKKK